MNTSRRAISILALTAACISALFAYNPPVGGESASDFLSPDLLAGGTSVAGGAFGSLMPGELAVNPALSAGEQRIAVDASYAMLAGTGSDTGVGHAFNLGGLYPARWGVFAASANFLTANFDSLPLGTAGSVRLSVSKDLTKKLYLGAGFSGTAGSGWGASGSLGMLYRLGPAGFMKDARLGVSLTGIGRPFTTDGAGVAGGTADGYDSLLTPRAGFAATLVDANLVKIGGSADLSFPTFQNVVFGAGLEAVFKNVVSVQTGWRYNLVEAINKKQTLVPSVGIGVKLAVNAPKDDSFLARNGWAQSEVTPTVAFKPLWNDIYAFGGGVNVKLGVTDTEPPVITVDYPEPAWISPNNDGVKDALELPVKITDRRDVVAWSFVIEDAAGNVVRTISNKEDRTVLADIKSFWKLLTKVKKGIALPDSLRWDGIRDAGDTAADGEYAFSVTAQDDNGNLAKTGKFTFHIDNTAPSVTATPPQGANAMIFSPDGDGNKDTFRIAQTGSAEDLWTATVLDSAGATVRTVETKGAAPADFAWDGRTDASAIAADGVYAYRIAATDRAGNRAEAKVDNIIIDTEKPSINVSIDTAAFSPNGDGVKDTVLLAPSIPVLTGLIDWKVAIYSRSGEAVREYAGTGAAKPIPFDGNRLADGTASRAAEGEYQAVITARYTNGYAPEARSPFFTLDVTAPEARVRASGKIFSPVGDGKLDTVTFTQETSAEQAWTAEIFPVDAEGKIAGKAIQTVQLGSSPDSTFVWDGRDSAGKLALDGRYAYRLSSTDRAGNTGSSSPVVVELNTEKADLILQANLSAFSPNGDGVKDAISFTPILKAATAVERYSLVIRARDGSAVKTMSGTGKVPATIGWNGIADPAPNASAGERVADGVYTASLEVTLVNQQTSRSAAPDFEIDTKFPTIDIFSPYILFSPNGDGKRDSMTVTQKSSAEDAWTGTLANDKNATVRSWAWKGKADDFTWDATDNAGNRVSDGTYVYTVSCEDRAGNRTRAQLAGIRVDSRVPKAYVTAEHAAFSPNGDGIKDTQRLSIVTSVPEGLQSWSVAIVPETATAPVRVWTSETSVSAGSAGSAGTGNAGSASPAALPAAINWDGKDSSGKLVQGPVHAELTLDYAKGDAVSAKTPAFLVNAIAPELNVKLTPRWFSPDNDGIDDELFINLTARSASAFAEWSFEIREPDGTAGNVFWKTGGTGTITDRIVWDGRSLKGELVQAATDYPFTFTVKDEVGMTSVVRGYIPVDVLVIRDGDKLKIAVPSIIFRENGADFNGLKTDVVDKNTQVLRRIAEILNKFREYKIQVEGHANNVTGTQKEEDAELIPLSRMRADAVKAFLVANGVDAARLSTVGMGGTRPVAQRSDRENWWKNRRVEFILIK